MRLLLCAICFLSVLNHLDVFASSPPNILFILVDDQRHDSLGCAGHPILKTPTIDRLAEQGMRFENMFVSTSICMASRASIFTGLTETGHGYTGGSFPATPVISSDVDTAFPVLLRQSGYRTGFFGKQHVRFQEGTDEALNRMFDDHATIHRRPYFKEQSDGSLRHTAELIGDQSVAFLESQSSDQPFCLYMSFNISHAEDGDKRPGIGHYPWPHAVDGLYENIIPPSPRLGDPKYFESLPTFLQQSMNRDRWFWRWDTPEKYTVNMRAYLRMLTGMDRVVDRVLKSLKDNQLDENTVVIYSADNGYYMGDRGFAGKWTHFDQSLRVPLIIYDPRRPANSRGHVEKAPVLNIDLPATMLELAGLSTPEKYQGRSVLPFLQGKTPSDWRTDHFHEHLMDNPSIPKWHGVRNERYTYAKYFGQTPAYEFLHDREKDPDEIQNLVQNPHYTETLQAMRARCNDFLAQYTRQEIVDFKKIQSTQPKNKRSKTRKKE